MAKISNRNDFRDYVLRRLGYPVIEINVDDDQIEDRIDDGLQLFREYAADGQLRVFQPVLITQAMVDAKSIDLNTALPAVANRILDVVKVFMIGDSTSNVNFFDIKYQMMLNDIADLMNFAGDLAYYEQMQQYLSLLDMKLNGHPQVQFARRQNRLYIFGDFADGDIKEGDFIVAEVYSEVNDSDHTSIFNDMFVKEYTTALIKQQWGMNLIKFEGMQLPGGVILNGRQIYDDATGEIATLRENLRLEHEFPPDFFVG